MSEFQLTIELGNSAMSAPDDVAHALIKLGEDISLGRVRPDIGSIRDGNGNTVGHYSAGYPTEDTER